MPRGLFAQSLTVLAQAPPSLVLVQAALATSKLITKKDPMPEGTPWVGGHPDLVYEYRPDLNGKILVNVIPLPWPDTCGDPEADPETFAAWVMGFLGPCTYPGSLQRAVQQTPGGEQLSRHGAVVRLSLTYGEPGRPKAGDPVDELKRLTAMAQAVLTLPEAVAFFNPNGEVLSTAANLQSLLNYSHQKNQLPLDAWTNLRLYGAGQGWAMMDSVGMGQLDQPDVEACFPEGYKTDEIAALVRTVGTYMLRDRPIASGDTLNGPRGTWVAVETSEGLVSPPRPTVRLFPGDADPPDELIPAGEG